MSEQQLPDIRARFVMDMTGLTKAQSQAQQFGRNLDNLGRGPDPISTRFRPAGQTLDEIGTKLSLGVSVPLGALGLKALNTSRDFDTAFARMQSLAGVTADEVAGLEESIKQLAGETGRAPVELADALYFARSAGLDAATAMETVEASARAAAIGLGDTDRIVDAVTSAIGAYGPANLKAAAAVDILTAAAQSAKIEASELAPQLGRLLPTASQLGVGFDEVAAAMAFLSQKSGDASLSATQLDGVLRKILLPSEQGKKALDELGLSADELRAIISADGLEGALAALKAAGLDPSSEALGRIFDDIQAAQGAMLLLDDATGGLQSAFESTAGSAGLATDKFNEFAQSDAFKRQQDLANLQTALIDLGTTIAPVVGDLTSGLSSVVDAFQALPEPVQEAIVYAGLFAFAVGPAIKAATGIADAIGLARTAFASLSTAGTTLATLGPAAIGVAGAVTIASLAFKGWIDRQREAAQATREARSAVEDMTQSLALSSIQQVRNTIDARNQRDDLTRLGITYGQLAAAILRGGDAAATFRRRLVETGEVDLRDAIAPANEASQELIDTWIRTGDASGIFIAGNTGIVDTLNDLTTSTRESAIARIDDAVALEALTAAQGENLKSQGDWVAAVDAANAAIARQQTSSDDLAATQEENAAWLARYQASQQQAATATDDTTVAVEAFVSELDLAAATVDGFRSAIDRLVGVNLDVEEATLAAVASARALSDALEENGGSLELNTEAGEANRDAIVSSTRDQLALAEAMVRQDGNTKRATGSLQLYVGSLRNQLLATGLAEDAVDAYLTTLGLTPEQVETTIEAIGADIEREKVEQLRAELDKLPEESTTDIRAALDRGDIDEAFRLFEELTKPEDKVINIVTRGGGGGGFNTRSAEGNQLSAGQASIVGEKGRELFVPTVDGRILPANIVDALERTLAATPRTAPVAAGYQVTFVSPRAIDENEAIVKLRMLEMLNA